MKSQNSADRRQAFGEALKLLASNKSTSQEADHLRLSLFQLLATENNDQTAPANEREGEESGEYYASLVGFVASLEDERAIPALLGASMTGGIATRAVARFGNKAVGPVTVQTRSKDAHLSEGALLVIRNMLQFQTTSDPDSQLRIKEALREALARPEEIVRETAIAAVEYLSDREEFVPVLREIAEHDPYLLDGERSTDMQDNGQIYPVRRAARLLLRQIANHERPVVDQGVSH
jgi:hypothetical protein